MLKLVAETLRTPAWPQNSSSKYLLIIVVVLIYVHKFFDTLSLRRCSLTPLPAVRLRAGLSNLLVMNRVGKEKSSVVEKAGRHQLK